MELKGYIFPKNAVFRYAFFPYGVLFGAFVSLHLSLQLSSQQHFLHFFCTRQHPRFAPLWYHFPSVRQMVFNASFNGVQRVSSAPLVPGCCAAWSRSMSCHRSPLICHRSPPFLAVSHARALLYYARVCTKTVRTPAKPLCKRVLSHSRTSAHRTKEKPPGSRF